MISSLSTRSIEFDNIQTDNKIKKKKNNIRKLLVLLGKSCAILAAINIAALVVAGSLGIGLGLGLKALAPKLYGGSCSKTSDCVKLPTNSFICSNGTCKCSNTSDYINYKCVDKKSYLSSCDSTYTCNQNLRLQCINSTCICYDKTQWSGTSCEAGYYSATCNSTTQCQTYNGLQCINKTCDCASTDYWNVASCTTKKLFNVSCTSNSQCDDSLDLFCLNGVCDCNSTLYYNGTICTPKKIYGDVCTNENECQDYLNPPLYCNNTCLCPNTHYWSTSLCVPKKTYQEVCSAVIKCDDSVSLVCPTSANTCNCPTTSTAYKCDCPSGYFWDSVNQICDVRKTYNDICTAGANYECQSNLICTSGACSCLSTQFWDTSSKTCVNKYPFGRSCTNTYECQDYNSLTCNNNICTCPGSQIWNGATSTCSNDVTLTICENGMININCGNGFKINVMSGWYGRMDVITCLPCVACNSNCYYDSKTVLSSRFNGLTSMALQLTNSMIGIDPCGGTYKYSVIKFQCI